MKTWRPRGVYASSNTMLDVVALSVVLVVGLFFLALGVVSLVRPSITSGFLLGFAGSRSKHLVELLVRLLAGWALIAYAPRMALADVFASFGWVLILTTAGLLLVPWRVHQSFARRTVPRAVQWIGAIGVCSLLAGVGLFAGVICGSGPR